MNIELSNQKILVTGGAGFIGSNLCEALLDKGNKVVDKIEEIEKIGYASGTCLFTSREVVDKIGLLDEFLFLYHLYYSHLLIHNHQVYLVFKNY